MTEVNPRPIQRSLLAAEFRELAEVPPAAEWFANLDNANTMKRIASTPAGWVFFGLTVLLAVWIMHWEVVSSDWYRAAIFRWHKADFQAIRDMLDHDRSITLIGCDRLEPEHLSQTSQRLAEYRQHLSRIGCPTVTYYLVAGVNDTAFSWDINQASDVISIPGSPKLPADGYGRIEGDWYLWYRRGFP